MRSAMLAGMLPLVLSSTGVEAAVTRSQILVCKSRPDFETALRGFGTKEKTLARVQQMVDAGVCDRLPLGLSLSVEASAGELWCVRPLGQVECYWTLRQLIDLRR
jgi:hypothetical protein